MNKPRNLIKLAVPKRCGAEGMPPTAGEVSLRGRLRIVGERIVGDGSLLVFVSQEIMI